MGTIKGMKKAALKRLLKEQFFVVMQAYPGLAEKCRFLKTQEKGIDNRVPLRKNKEERG